MQAVSPNFKQRVESAKKQTNFAMMIAWEKQLNPNTHFFNLNSSTLDGGDFLKGSGDAITFFDKYKYTDESKYVKNWRMTKKMSKYSYGVVSAQATITLNNGTGRFLPGNDETIGDYIKAGRPIKILTGYDGEMITNFVGFLGMPTVNIVEQTVEFTAFDAITYLDAKYSNLPAFVNKPAHEIVRSLLIEQGFSADQFDIDNSHQVPISYLSPKGRSVTSILSDLAEAEAAIVFVDEQGIIHFWNRTHFGIMEPVWTFNYSNLRDLHIRQTAIINKTKVIAKPYKIQAFQKLWELEHGNEQTKIGAGKTINIFAEFRDDIGEFYAVSVDNPVPFANNTGSSFFAGAKNEDGTGGNLNLSLTSVYNFGSSYRMTLKNNSGFDGYVTMAQLWGVPAKISQIITEESVNETSVQQYGINPDTSTGIGEETLVIENNLIQNVGGAKSVANNLVSLYANPSQCFSVKNFFIPQLQIGDPVELQINELEKPFSCAITGYELAGGVNANFRQSLELEGKLKQDWFVLNNSALDGRHVLAN